MQGAVDDQAGHFVDDVFEIKFGDAVALEIRSGIQEIDGVGDSVLDREFDGVHLVAEGLVDRLRVFHDTRAELGRQIVMIDEVLALLGIVVNGQRYRIFQT